MMMGCDMPWWSIPCCSHQEDEGFYIRSGIVTVLRNAEIPDGTVV